MRVAGTSTTVTVAVPLLPPPVAVITAVPGPTAVTRPEASTVATLAESTLHVKVVPETPPPAAVKAAADNCPVVPVSNESEGGVMLT